MLSDETSIFGLLQSRIGMLSKRQRVIAENVANVNTPAFIPRDIDKQDFDDMLIRVAGGKTHMRLMTTSPQHFDSQKLGNIGDDHLQDSPDSETTIDGNSVVIEEQMLRLSETRLEFDSALALYQKGLQLLRIAAKSPSR